MTDTLQMTNENAIYLDNAASTPVESDVLDFFKSSSLKYYANQESVHSAGYIVRCKLEEAAEKLSALTTGSSSASALWTNSGTDSINTALSLDIFRKGNIVMAQTEHPALREAALRFAGNPALVRFVEVSKEGEIDLPGLADAIDKNTALVAVHHVQNETGRIQDLIKIREIIDSKKTNALFLSDTVQSACKLDIPWDEARLDFALVSGHKIGAPSGGAVICRDKSIFSMLRKVRDERYMTGRVNPPDALTLAFAAERLVSLRDSCNENILSLSTRLREKLSGFSGKAQLSIPAAFSSPYITHFTVSGHQGAVLARMLSKNGVMVSSGSACMAESKLPSKTLLAMGMKREKAFSAIRASFWTNTTAQDVDAFAGALKSALANY